MSDSPLFCRCSDTTCDAAPTLVLLHGWGMNAGVWDGITPALQATHRVCAFDLPGHARSRDYAGDYSLAAQAAAIAASLPPRSILLGWSLGGLLATQIAADFPQRVAALVLVASSPRFVRGDDWPDAMQAEVLQAFANELQQDYDRTIRRFLAIQALGSEQAREELRLLRDTVFRHGQPQPAALRAGLEILMHADLRPRLAGLRCPTLLIGGERDTLFPQAAARRTLPLLDDARLAVIEGAGHAPFLSHPAAFNQALRAFLDDLDARGEARDQ